jgi:hypothetical protein
MILISMIEARSFKNIPQASIVFAKWHRIRVNKNFVKLSLERPRVCKFGLKLIKNPVYIIWCHVDYPESIQHCCNNEPTSVIRVPVGEGRFCIRQSQPQMKWHARALLKPDLEMEGRSNRGMLQKSLAIASWAALAFDRKPMIQWGSPLLFGLGGISIRSLSGTSVSEREDAAPSIEFLNYASRRRSGWLEPGR